MHVTEHIDEFYPDLKDERFADVAEPPAHCVFEHVYFASPASNVFDQNVQLDRKSVV